MQGVPVRPTAVQPFHACSPFTKPHFSTLRGPKQEFVVKDDSLGKSGVSHAPSVDFVMARLRTFLVGAAARIYPALRFLKLFCLSLVCYASSNNYTYLYLRSQQPSA